MKENETMLPTEFKDLERFVNYWLLDTSQERVNRRSEALMTNIQDFYDTVFARMKDILAHFEGLDLDSLPPESENLFKLFLALPHTAMAVEFHEQPRVPYSPYPNGLRIVRSIQPYGM
jgi:hypothetical protein